eukprot:4936658-Amphidinium_carterae.1
MPDPDYYDDIFDAFNEGQAQLQQQTARVAQHVEQTLRETFKSRKALARVSREIDEHSARS